MRRLRVALFTIFFCTAFIRPAAAEPDSLFPDNDIPDFSYLGLETAASGEHDGGPDSVLHFLGGFSAGCLSSAVIAGTGTDSWIFESGAAPAGAAVMGALKEGLDALGTGDVELRDFAWTLAGGITAAVLDTLLNASGVSGYSRPIALATLGAVYGIPVAELFVVRLHRMAARDRME